MDTWSRLTLKEKWEHSKQLGNKHMLGCQQHFTVKTKEEANV